MKSEKKSEENLTIEEDEISNLKHFIYLDKNKLHSYSSQIFKGIVQIKRLTENEGIRSTQNSDEEFTEKIQEDGKEGEITAGPKNILGGISGKTIDKTTHRNSYKKGISTESNESLNSLTEDIIEHDYGYLKFEEILIENKMLKQISNIEDLEQYPALVRIKGSCRFIDWDSIVNLFNNQNVIDILIKSSHTDPKSSHQQKKEEEKSIKLGIDVIKAFSLGAVTVNTKIGNSNLIGSINPEHLRLAREQLRSAYIMPGDTEMIIVGFIPKRITESIIFPGLAGKIDMKELWKVWVGKIDAVIEPIAIYTEIRQ